MPVVRRFLPVACSLLLSLLIAGPLLAQVRVGRNVPVDIHSARDYPGSDGRGAALVWSETVHRPGATYVALHFRDFDLAPGDYLAISDAAGGQSYRLEGRGKRGAGTFWARHVKGDTVRLELYAASPDGGPGFSIDEIAEGTVRTEEESIRATCGTDDKRNAVCYRDSHPVEYGRSRAVARLLINGTTLCTGWLVSAHNHLLTNAHCVSSERDALNTDFEFMAEAPECAAPNCILCYPGDVYSGAILARLNARLDYSLLVLDGGDPASLYGHLEIDPRLPDPGEPIYIPQHPGGRAKELALFSSESADPSGECEVLTAAEPSCFGSTEYDDVGYLCDTEGGSSGAPVISRSTQRVVALHHCADCPNRGVPIDRIHDEIAALLDSQCSTAGECDDGQFCNGAEGCASGVCVAGSYPCGVGDVCDEAADRCVVVCDFDGICEVGEDCDNCSSDCTSGASAAGVCGNDVCEVGAGEDCHNCPKDCNGRTGGPTYRRFCCGGLTGCYAPLCNDKGNTCSFGVISSDTYCCGDALCSGGEDPFNCSRDCSSQPVEGCDHDGICDPGEDCRTCSEDCEGRTTGRKAERFCCGNGTVEGPENPQFCDGNF